MSKSNDMPPTTLPKTFCNEQTGGIPISVAYGDGIGPEIMAAVLRVLAAAEARLQVEVVSIGERAFLSGEPTGIPQATWAALRRTRVFLKAPVTTPQGGGFKSLNVTTRKALGLYANIRPCVAHAPFVRTRHPEMDLVIVRENEEDLYAGIEHQQTDDVVQCLKLITRPGCERIVRCAFEYARRNGRRKVSCMVKDNIMKMTDGLFHRVFDEIGATYPDIEKDAWIIDIGAAMLADRPEIFDVVVTPNLYGDILSDVVAQTAGSVGMGGSANIGDQCAMFEAIHGSAPKLAGQDVANPSGLLNGAIQMLLHIGQQSVAERVHNAWLCTLEDGIHTADIHSPEHSRALVGTAAFADAVIARLGRRPGRLSAVRYGAASGDTPPPAPAIPRPPARKTLVGIDVFLHWTGGPASELGEHLSRIDGTPLRLQVITNRGVRVWPDGFPETTCVDHWRCRFRAGPESVAAADLLALQHAILRAGFDIIKTENLYLFDGEPGFSAVHG